MFYEFSINILFDCLTQDQSFMIDNDIIFPESCPKECVTCKGGPCVGWCSIYNTCWEWSWRDSGTDCKKCRGILCLQFLVLEILLNSNGYNFHRCFQSFSQMSCLILNYMKEKMALRINYAGFILPNP